MKISRQQWLEAATTILSQQGPGAVRIESLCRALGVTKGSFYHHFGNLEGFKQALLEDWYQRETSQIISVLPADISVAERRDALTAMAHEIDARLEKSLRGWALYDAGVAEWVARVDRERLAFLISLAEGQTRGGLSAEMAARIAYTSFTGARQLSHLLSQDEIEIMDAQLQTLLLNSEY